MHKARRDSWHARSRALAHSPTYPYDQYNAIPLFRWKFINMLEHYLRCWRRYKLSEDSRVVPPRPNYETNHKLMARSESLCCFQLINKSHRAPIRVLLIPLFTAGGFCLMRVRLSLWNSYWVVPDPRRVWRDCSIGGTDCFELRIPLTAEECKRLRSREGETTRREIWEWKKRKGTWLEKSEGKC